ncbi:MAG: 4Fe-4S dicluster domain-containing protein [Saprospiraceae bacterium]
MAIIITEDCISCDACISECPNNAIYEPSEPWKLSDGTALEGDVTSPSGTSLDADEEFDAVSDDVYYIVSLKCTECKGFFDEPQCASVCPVDACVPDGNNEESEDALMDKKAWLHGE